jgi:hypothetical protein
LEPKGFFFGYSHLISSLLSGLDRPVRYWDSGKDFKGYF